MKEKPIVTAVLTTYKRPVEIVGRALKSVVEQTYEELEIILVNDFPEHEKLSKELIGLCRGFERNVVYLPMKKNSGANAARNYGAGVSKGAFIAFLDDDDEWSPEKIELQMQKMTDDNIGIVYCNTWINSEKSHSIKPRFKNAKPEGNIYPVLFGKNVVGSTSFPLIRKKAFDEVGGFNETMPALQDMELWLRIAQSYTVKYIHKPLGTYYFYIGDRISSHSDRRIAGYNKIYDEHKEYLEHHKKAKAGFDILGVTLYINAGDRKYAWKLLMEAIKLAPGNIKVNLFTLIKWIIRWFVPAKIV